MEEKINSVRTMDVQIGNKLIAEFIGWKYQEKTEHPHVFPHGIWVDTDNIGHKELLFHSSWDWLHDAWEKFRDIKLSLSDEGFCDTYSRHCMAISTAIHAYPILIAFERLSRAIQWYNKLKTTT